MSAVANIARNVAPAWPAADPAVVRCAGDDAFACVPFSQLSNDDVSSHVQKDLAYIRRLAEQHTIVALSDSGLPERPIDTSRLAEGQRHAAVAINKATTRVHAATEELRRREARDRESDRRKDAEARELLTDLLARGPAAAAELVAQVRAAVEAHARVAKLVRDLELLAELPRLDRAYRNLVEGVQIAAQTLAKEAPGLPAMPALPDAGETERLARVLVSPAAAELLRDLTLSDLKPSRAAAAAARLTAR